MGLFNLVKDVYEKLWDAVTANYDKDDQARRNLNNSTGE